jgi:small subunit ribosomal protein S5
MIGAARWYSRFHAAGGGGGGTHRHPLIRSSTQPSSVLEVIKVLLDSASAAAACSGGSVSISRSYGTFRPRRRPNKNYRPIQVGVKRVHDPLPANPKKFVNLAKLAAEEDDGGLEASFGELGAEFIDSVQRDRKRKFENNMTDSETMEDAIRSLDYYMAQTGTTEDVAGMRRALAHDLDTQEERDELVEELENMERELRLKDLKVDPESLEEEFGNDHNLDGEREDDDFMGGEDDPATTLDPNQLAHGEWSEQLIDVSRTVKLWRGGRLESYRALVIGGNMNGCGGFGVGKSNDPIEAVSKASRVTKRNIFFVERYQGDGITRDLVGKQNNCRVVLRATDNGLRGNMLCGEILKRFGIVNVASKAYGRRTPLNMVLGTFKALMTHESLEEISLKRGKRMLNMDRAMRLQI